MGMSLKELLKRDMDNRKPVPEGMRRYPLDSAYAVSEDGRVVDLNSGKELEVAFSAKGFPSVILGDGKSHWLNAVMCETFHGHRGVDKMASWIGYQDGRPWPLTADNCEWTSKEIADERRKEADKSRKEAKNKSCDALIRRIEKMVRRMSEENRERAFNAVKEIYAESAPRREELEAPEPPKRKLIVEELIVPEPPKEEEPKRELKPWEHGGPSNPNPQPLPEYVKPESGRGFWTDSMGQKHEIASADDPNAPF